MKPIAVVALLLVAILGSSSAFIVRENELAVLFQFGAVQRTDFGPGLHFKLPLVQNVRKFDRRILTLDSEPERFLTSEKKDVFVDFFVKWRIADVSKFYTASSGDEQLAAQRLAPIVRGADTDRPALAPQAAGLAATSIGLSRLHADDDPAMLEAAMTLYDALYAWCRDGRDEVHAWTPAGATR